MNIYLVRHGETTSNLEKTWRTANEDLTEKGIEQAKKVAARIHKLDIDHMVVSSAKRTRQTAEIIAQETGLTFEENPLFYEEKAPTSIQGLVHEKTPDNPIEQYLAALLEHADDPDYHYEDDENLHDRKVRVEKMLEYLAGKDGKNILVVSHGNILKLFTAYVLVGPDCTAKELYLTSQRLKTSNTGITKIIRENNMWRVLIWNDHAHFAE